MARADLPRAIHSWATRRGLMLVLSGIDLNPRSAIEAVAATPTGTVIAWKTGDVFDQAPEPKPDFVVRRPPAATTRASTYLSCGRHATSTAIPRRSG